MMITPGTLLSKLPVLHGNRDVIAPNQTNKDIVKEVLNAHEFFEPDYDTIADDWLRDGSCDTLPYRLYAFCKKFCKYREEGMADQTTRSPAGILAMNGVDCKHYSGFIAGILDAANRTGKCYYDWSYRFASYEILSFSPAHVFVVIKGDREIWIDPVPDIRGFNGRNLKPVYQWDKSFGNMALTRISGINFRPFAKGFSHVNVVSRSSIADDAIARNCIRGIGNAASSYYHASSGAVFANDDTVRSNGLTPDQMGLPYAMEVLARGYDNKHPGAADEWWINPPVMFVLNGQQVGLPPPNTVVGGQVPLLPVGLTVQYAASFMGIPIPSNMIKPVVVANPGGQNKLRLSPQDIPGFPGSATNNKLSANDSFLLIILEAAVGPIINSYSSYPYASNFSSTNNLDDKLFNHRNADDLLQPSISKTALQTVAPIAEAILPYVVPGLGTYASALLKTVAPGSTGLTTTQVQATLPSAVQQGAKVDILTTIEDNPVPALLIGGVALWGLFELLGSRKKKRA